jgi:hypothetical protein
MSGRNVRLKLAVCGAFLFSACGKDTNINQIFKISGEDERIDTLLALGRIHYDRGEHEKAGVYASEAYEINHNNEKAAILYAYVLLGQVGIDPFSMAGAIIKKTEDEAAAKVAAAKGAKLAETASTTSGASALSDFATLINIEKKDIELMGKVEDSELAIFADIPIFVPAKADAEGGPRTTNNTLVHIKQAVDVICPFIASAARVEGYSRHTCTSATGVMKFQSKSHFLWALAHLGEALAFNSAMLYSPTTTGTLTASATPDTGLFKRATALSTKGSSVTIDGIADYVAAVIELKTNVAQIFDTASDSMLFATLSDLTAVTLAFGQIAGMPDTITKKITAGLATIKELGSKLSTGADSELDQRTAALKLQMSKTLNTSLKTSIDAFSAKYSEEEMAKLSTADQETVTKNKETLCTTYKDLSGFSAGDTSAALPTGC